MSSKIVRIAFLAGTAICWLYGIVTFFGSLPTPMSPEQRTAYQDTLIQRRVTDKAAYEKSFFDADRSGISIGLAFIAGGFAILGLSRIANALERRTGD